MHRRSSIPEWLSRTTSPAPWAEPIPFRVFDALPAAPAPMAAPKPPPVARLVFNDGTSQPVTEAMLARLKQHQTIFELVEHHLDPLRRKGEGLKNVVKRLARFYQARHPETRTFFLASYMGGSWMLHNNGQGLEDSRTQTQTKRMTLKEARKAAEAHIYAHGAERVMILQEVPLKTRVEVFTPDSG